MYIGMLKSKLVWISDNLKSFGLKSFGFWTFFSVWKPNYGIELNDFCLVLYIRDQTERSNKPNSPNVWNTNVCKLSTKKFGFWHCSDFGRSDFCIPLYTTFTFFWLSRLITLLLIGRGITGMTSQSWLKDSTIWWSK